MLQKIRSLSPSPLTNYLFAALSVYTFYAVLYERLLMHPYYNNSNGETEFQMVPALLIFWEQNFAWAFIQVFSEFKLTKTQLVNPKLQIPLKVSGLFGVFKFAAIALFIEGIYETNFRFAFMVRTGIFFASTIASIIYSKISAKLFNDQKLIEIFCALLLLGGTVLFWIYDPEICFYVPIEPRVKGAIMIIGSVLVEGTLGVVKSEYLNKEKVNGVRMQRDMSVWLTIISYFYLLSKGSFTEDFKYSFRHLQYFAQVLIVGFLCFLAQLIELKASLKIPSVCGYLTSAGMFLTVMISYTFSVHPYYRYQIVGLVLSFLGILGGLLVRGNREQGESIRESKHFKPYEMVCDLEIEE